MIKSNGNVLYQIPFHKLTYKKAFAMQTRNGKKTIYAHLLTDKAF